MCNKNFLVKPKKLKLTIKSDETILTKDRVDIILFTIYGIKDTDYEYEYFIKHRVFRNVYKIKIVITFNKRHGSEYLGI